MFRQVIIFPVAIIVIYIGNVNELVAPGIDDFQKTVFVKVIKVVLADGMEAVLRSGTFHVTQTQRSIQSLILSLSLALAVGMLYLLRSDQLIGNETSSLLTTAP